MTDASCPKGGCLERWLSHGLLIGGFLLMMMDIRFEHRPILIEHQIAWVPIFYSMAMLVLIPLGVALWKKGGNHLLKACYIGAMAVGLVGVYFHADGNLLSHLSDLLTVWVTKFDPNGSFYPPILAPFAFLGLGLIGLFFVLREEFTASKS